MTYRQNWVRILEKLKKKGKMGFHVIFSWDDNSFDGLNLRGGGHYLLKFPSLSPPLPPSPSCCEVSLLWSSSMTGMIYDSSLNYLCSNSPDGVLGTLFSIFFFFFFLISSVHTLSSSHEWLNICAKKDEGKKKWFKPQKNKWEKSEK